MEIQRAYCSATDRNIRVLRKPGAKLGDTPGVGDCEALMCLEYGVTCTGAFCPLFDVPALPEDALLASRARGSSAARPASRARSARADRSRSAEARRRVLRSAAPPAAEDA